MSNVESFSISELQLLRGLLSKELSTMPKNPRAYEWRRHVERTLKKVDKLEEQKNRRLTP